MAFAIRTRHDPAPELLPLPGLDIRRELDAATIGLLQARPTEEMQRRFDAGHRVYVASLGGEDAAWGWVGTRSATIGEVGADFRVPDGDRYLWNFVTVPHHRGRGIYPRLIEEIIKRESIEAERFWIAYAPENHASGAGIRKAGFHVVAELSFDAEGQPAVRSVAPGGGRVLALMLGVPESSQSLTPCWRCVRAGRGAMACREGACACDYQRPQSACAA